MGYKELLQSLSPSPASSSTASMATVSRSTTSSDAPTSLSAFEKLFAQHDHPSHHSENHLLPSNNDIPNYAFNVMADTILNGREDHPREPSVLDASHFEDISALLIQEAVRISLFLSEIGL